MSAQTRNHLCYYYLKLLEKTVKIEWEQPEAFACHNVVGFWHEDSFAMNLVLGSLPHPASIFQDQGSVR